MNLSNFPVFRERAKRRKISWPYKVLPAEDGHDDERVIRARAKRARKADKRADYEIRTLEGRVGRYTGCRTPEKCRPEVCQ